ncbi:MAG: hypothetical protein KUG77_18530, partial [Nannocystaceae bacterium]|nr:hypothetical protein [Nannocystaceae bacterium]
VLLEELAGPGIVRAGGHAEAAATRALEINERRETDDERGAGANIVEKGPNSGRSGRYHSASGLKGTPAR